MGFVNDEVVGLIGNCFFNCIKAPPGYQQLVTAYDAMGRLVQKKSTFSTLAEFAYTATGQRALMRDNLNSEGFTNSREHPLLSGKCQTLTACETSSAGLWRRATID